MFICNNCGEIFSESKTINNWVPYGEGLVAEEWGVCPYCESRSVSEAKKCKMCGEYVAELDETNLCDVCAGDMYGE